MFNSMQEPHCSLSTFHTLCTLFHFPASTFFVIDYISLSFVWHVILLLRVCTSTLVQKGTSPLGSFRYTTYSPNNALSSGLSLNLRMRSTTRFPCSGRFRILSPVGAFPKYLFISPRPSVIPTFPNPCQAC